MSDESCCVCAWILPCSCNHVLTVNESSLTWMSHVCVRVWILSWILRTVFSVNVERHVLCEWVMSQVSESCLTSWILRTTFYVNVWCLVLCPVSESNKWAKSRVNASGLRVCVQSLVNESCVWEVTHLCVWDLTHWCLRRLTREYGRESQYFCLCQVSGERFVSTWCAWILQTTFSVWSRYIYINIYTYICIYTYIYIYIYIYVYIYIYI